MKTPLGGSATKRALRADARARRDALSAVARAAASAAIAKRAIALIAGAKPSVIAAYKAIRTEVDSDPIIDWALGQGIVVVLPSVREGATLAFQRFRVGDTLIASTFGTLAPPRDAPEIDPDLVILPMIAFDRSGTRLGHGRGFYDRAIWILQGKGSRPALIGLAFAVQEVTAIPSEAHDVRMDWIVTEKETLDFGRFG